jgi:hypothetical protein
MNGSKSGTPDIKGNTQDINSSDNNSNTTDTSKRFSILWDYAISVNMSSIVYLHCHQHGNSKIEKKKKIFIIFF